ncbi:MAG: LysR family transcriptional regulator [Phenylobacterium sp.]|uniref:TOBE domain-containing protein n=1 Tax=Phenylobacterium sp. TaxID=1871053 RepID=UPI0011FB96AD|nr:TOBE domain-containing protein [Phenylobacterium sp.]TAJ71633.1 MAG: LysR family transcriptional regulator [Phenylobacterium sp.]
MLSATVTLERAGLPRVALARMALVEAVGELGSISAAARKVGLSYKAAWDAVQALNNLFDAPLISAAPGGKAGGAAQVTPRGQAALAAFRRVQAEMDAALAKLDQGLGADVFWSLGMKTSARNALRGRIVRVTTGTVNTEVTLRLADGLDIVAIVTAHSVEELGLAEGAPAIALIKSSFVILAKGEGLRTSARNQIAGTVAAREDGAVNSEVRLDIGAGKTLVATITLDSAQALDLAVGDAVTALVKAPHVILAIE